MLPEEQEYDKGIKWTSVEVLLPLIILLFMALFTGRLGYFEVGVTQAVFFGCTALALFSIITMDEFKHKTRKIVLPTGSTTFTGDILVNTQTNNAMAKAGTIRALGVEIDEFSEGMLIFPLDCLEKTGKCAVVNADYVKKVKLKEIDDKLIAAWLLREGIGEPYYQAKNYIPKRLRKPDYRRLVSILDNMAKSNDILKAKIEAKWTVTEDSVAAGSRIRDIASEMQQLRDKIKEKGKEE